MCTEAFPWKELMFGTLTLHFCKQSKVHSDQSMGFLQLTLCSHCSFFYLQNEGSFPLIDCFGAAIWKTWNILSPALPVNPARVDLFPHL